MVVCIHTSTPLRIDRFKKKGCFCGDVLLACESGVMESFTWVTCLCSWKVTIAYPVYSFVFRMVELKFSLYSLLPISQTSSCSPSDWGRHVAEILLGRSLQWNVHRISLQCLRGSVLPYCLWVSDHTHTILGPQGYLLDSPRKDAHLCPAQWGHWTIWDCVLWAQPWAVNGKMGHWVVSAWGISTGHTFPSSPKNLRCGPSFVLN